MTYVAEALFECPDCGYQHMVPRMAVSQLITCHKCKNSVTIPPSAPHQSSGVIEASATPLPFGVTPLPVTLSAQEQAALASAVPIAQDLGAIPSAKPTTRFVPHKTPTNPTAPPSTIPPTKTPGTGTITRTLEFTCAACNSRMRLPNQYLGKSILCPKCKAPQKVIVRARSNEPMKTTRSFRKDGSGETVVGDNSASRTVGPRRAFNTPLPSTMEYFDEAAVIPIPGSSASRPAVATAAAKSGTASITKPVPDHQPATNLPTSTPAATTSPDAAATYGMTMAIPANRPSGAAGSVSGAKSGIAGSTTAPRQQVVVVDPRPVPPARLLMPWMVAVAFLGLVCIGLVAWLSVTVPNLMEIKGRLAAAETDRRTSTEAELAAKRQLSDLTKQLAATELRLAETLEKLTKAQAEQKAQAPTGEAPVVPAAGDAAPATEAGKPADPVPGKR